MADRYDHDRRLGARRGRVLIASAVAAVLVSAGSGITTTAAAEPVTTTTSISTSCVGATAPDNDLITSLGLKQLSMQAASTTPGTVAVDSGPVTARVSLSYELAEVTSEAGRKLGLERIDLSGTTIKVRRVGPGADAVATATPPAPSYALGPALRIDLGSVELPVPTDVPGAAAVLLDPVEVRLTVTPGDRVVRATCTPSPLPEVPYSFVTTPGAPTVTPPVRDVQLATSVRDTTVDLRTAAVAATGTTVSSWRVVRTFGAGTATVSNTGTLSAGLGDGPGLDVVWEACATPTPTTTTASTTSTTTAVEPVAEAVTAEDPAPTETTTAPPSTAPGETPACAQGVVRVRPTLTSTALGAGISQTRESNADAAPLSFTG